MNEARVTAREVLRAVEQLDKKLDAHVEICKIRCRNVEKHSETLYGNGRRGLTSQVNLLMWVLGIMGTGLVVVVGVLVERMLR